MLFDWFVAGHVIDVNPAHAVRRRKYVVNALCVTDFTTGQPQRIRIVYICMAVQEIESLPDAQERLKGFFGDLQDGDEYAKLAYFLSDPNKVAEALNEVSKGIWVEYLKQEYKGKSNRFTRAIIRYATAFGFACQENVVFTGPLSSASFLGYVQNGVLWKDTFAPEHGEFSHTFQWLAAGVALNWGAATATYFKHTNRDSIAQMWSRGASGPERATQKLWAWLVDCFPSTNNQNINGLKDNIYSDTCRVPNVITRLVQGKEDMFINRYVNYRHQVKLGRAKTQGKQDAVYEKRFEGREKMRSRAEFQAIKSYQTDRYEGNATWQKLGDQERVKTEAGVEKDVHRSFSRPTSYEPLAPIAKDMVEAEFHGIRGNIPAVILPYSLRRD